MMTQMDTGHVRPLLPSERSAIRIRAGNIAEPLSSVREMQHPISLGIPKICTSSLQQRTRTRTSNHRAKKLTRDPTAEAWDTRPNGRPSATRRYGKHFYLTKSPEYCILKFCCQACWILKTGNSGTSSSRQPRRWRQQTDIVDANSGLSPRTAINESKPRACTLPISSKATVSSKVIEIQPTWHDR